MYRATLFLHSYWRWLIVALLVLGVINYSWGLVRGSPWALRDRTLARLTLYAFDVQIVLGLAMYLFLSPITRLALADFGQALRDEQLRVFALLHPAGVLMGIGCYGTGWLVARRRSSARGKHGWTLGATLVAATFIGIAVPWPGTVAGRPWLRMLGTL